MSARSEASERMRLHAAQAEEFLAVASDDNAVRKSSISGKDQAMVLRAAQVHATLALYWQGELRDEVIA